ncbi:hypothetical protein Tco_0078090 [Tanacetum coccineum]
MRNIIALLRLAIGSSVGRNDGGTNPESSCVYGASDCCGTIGGHSFVAEMVEDYIVIFDCYKMELDCKCWLVKQVDVDNVLALLELH